MVTATLSTTDAYVTMTDSLGSFGSIPSYSTASNTGDQFGFLVAADAPYDHPIVFSLNVHALNGTYTSTLTYTIKVASWDVNVSGVIDHDTTWTGDKRYTLTGDVLVQPGITLTVAPGALVQSTGLPMLIVKGTLLAEGTPAQTITMTTKLYLLDGLAKLNWCFYSWDLVTDGGILEIRNCQLEASIQRPDSWNTGPRSILVHDTTITGWISFSTATSTVDTTVDISNVAFRPSYNRRESGLFCVGPCRIVNSSFVGSALSLGVNSTVPANITGNLFANYTANDTRGALNVRSYTGASITNNTFVNNSTALASGLDPGQYSTTTSSIAPVTPFITVIVLYLLVTIIGEPPIRR